MGKHLGGWHRLWIVLAIVYLPVVVVFAWMTQPDPKSVTHDASLYGTIAPELKTRILNARIADATKELDFVRDAGAVEGFSLVEMPNGHVLVFLKELPDSDAEAAARAYWASVERVIAERRLQHVRKAIAWWVVPVAVLYVLGLAVGWAYRGFKRS